MSKNTTNNQSSLAKAEATVSAFNALRGVSEPELRKATKALQAIIAKARQMDDVSARVEYVEVNLPIRDKLMKLIALFKETIDPAHQALQAAVDKGDEAATEEAAADLAAGYEEAAKLSPNLKARFKELEQRVNALETNDKKQDKRLADLENIVARMLRGETIDVKNLPWEAQPTPVKTDPTPTKPVPVVSPEANETGATEDRPKKGLIASIIDGFRVGFNRNKGEGFPRPDQFAGQRTATNNTAAVGGAH